MIPNYQQCMYPFLSFLNDDRIHSLNECVNHVANTFNLTEDERNQLLPSGKAFIINNRVAWAKSYLSQAGLVETPKRGNYKISSIGKELLSRGITHIDNNTLMEYESFRHFINPNRNDSNNSSNNNINNEVVDNINNISHQPSYILSDDSTPEEKIDHAIGQINDILANDIINKIISVH